MNDEEKTMMVRRPAAPTLDWAAKKPKARLVCVDDSLLENTQKGLSITLHEGQEQVMGRDSKNPIVIESTNVSRKHAAIFSDAGGWGVRDLKSTNGVFVNGQKVSEARLNAGDVLKLGDIPFRFELEAPEIKPAAAAPETRPAVAAPQEPSAAEEDESDKTMMFGDVRAATKLLAAQEAGEQADASESAAKKKEKPPVAKPEVKIAVKGGHRAGADATTVLQVQPDQPRAKFPVVKSIFFAFVGVLVAGGIYFGVQMMMESNIVENSRDAVNRFVREAAINVDPKQFGEERKTLAKLRQELLAAITAAPDKAELPALLDRVLILEFERSFYEAMTANNFTGAREAIEATRRRIAGGGPGAHAEAQAMLAAMETALPYIEFGKAFPDPQQKAPAPTPAQLDELLKRKTEFSKLHRTVNMDLVRHPYLSRLLDQATQDIRLVERWELAVRRGSK